MTSFWGPLIWILPQAPNFEYPPLDIINFDKYLSDNNNNHVKHHYLLPNCHYMIVGSTGSGKTNLLINMIVKWMNYNCCVYTLNPDQNKYQFLQEQGIEILSLEDIPPVEELDSQEKVIVFDDIKLDNMNKIKEYFSLS